MNLKERNEEYIRGFGGRREEGKLMQLYHNHENKRNNLN